MISIIIPTYNEKANIERLISSIFRVAKDEGLGGLEIVVVDDNSPDGTADAAKAMPKEYNVRVLVRPEKLGLASAISDGFRVTKGDIVGVMDADFSHPPEKIAELVSALKDSSIAVGSRYVKGGETKDSLFRKAASKGATLMARLVLGLRVKDPLSGFFFVRRYVMEKTEIEAVGYKILLDILVKNRDEKVREVPFVFYGRRKGKSKLTFGEITNYFRTLWRLLGHR